MSKYGAEGDDWRTRKDAEQDARQLEAERLRIASVQSRRKPWEGLDDAVNVCARMEDHFGIPSSTAWRLLTSGDTTGMALKLRSSFEALPWMKAYSLISHGRPVPEGLLQRQNTGATVGP